MKLIILEGAVMKVSNADFKRAMKWKIANPDEGMMWERDFGAKYLGESIRVTDLEPTEAKELLQYECKATV